MKSVKSVKEILLATANPHKVKEYKAMENEFPITFIPQSIQNIPEIEETGTTFIENALLKAHHACQYTDLPVLAEDAGLVVEALQGAPGLYSSRYAGEKASQKQNIEKLLAELAKTNTNNRKAKFYVVTVLLRYPNDPAPIIAEGSIQGEIIDAPIGEHPFGYLPVFYLPEYQCTAGEISLAEKNKISHRAQACRLVLSRFLEKPCKL